MNDHQVQTFSILAGSAACNARCPFCVSKMTPPHGIFLREPEVNWRAFRRACDFVKQYNPRTAMITSKGEPTLFPSQVDDYLKILGEYNFPTIELQTNGIPIAEDPGKFESWLRKWSDPSLKGFKKPLLDLVAISVTHFDPEMNRRIYLPYKKEYIDLPALVHRLHTYKFEVRLAVVLVNGYIDSADKLHSLLNFGRNLGVEQITLRPVNRSVVTENEGVYAWVVEHHLQSQQLAEIYEYLNRYGRELDSLPHGAIVYDVDGQNVCLANSLTKDDPDLKHIRQLIFFPDGHLRADWEEGAKVLL